MYQGVRNVHFSGNIACFAFLKHLFWDSLFCLITNGFIKSNDLHNKLSIARGTLYIFRRHSNLNQIRKCFTQRMFVALKMELFFPIILRMTSHPCHPSLNPPLVIIVVGNDVVLLFLLLTLCRFFDGLVFFLVRYVLILFHM